MHKAVLFAILLFSAAGARGQEALPVAVGSAASTAPGEADAVHVLSGDDLAFRPPLGELVRALHGSGLSSASTSVLVAHDESGKVVALKLDRTTGSKLLDAAVLGWAAKLRLKPGPAGIGSLPITFELR
ncbi:MAG TPA: hypothetical protein VM576_07200 [Xanthomonadaceae bacterium]|nr:hypothetical protein [Xanthomonadaceae bacterium]